MAKLRCPTCDMSLSVKEEKLGSKVECDACGESFVAKLRASRTIADDEPEERRERSSTRRRYDDDFEDDDDNDDYEPRSRRKKKARSRSRTNAAPFVFAGVIFLGLVSTIGGLLFYFAAQAKPVAKKSSNSVPALPNPNGFAPLPPAAGMPAQPAPGLADPPAAAAPNNPPQAGEQKVTLSAPRWVRGGFRDFEVDYAFSNGRPIGGVFTLKFKRSDGTMGSARLLGLIQERGSVKIHVFGAGPGAVQGGPLEIWMEEGGFGGPFGPSGNVVSNRVTLN